MASAIALREVILILMFDKSLGAELSEGDEEEN